MHSCSPQHIHLFIFRIKHMVLPFPSEAFNLIMFPALESCFDYQEKNTVITWMEQTKRQGRPARWKELEKRVWSLYQKCQRWPGPRQSQPGSDCPVGAHMHPHQLQLGTVHLLIIFYPPPRPRPCLVVEYSPRVVFNLSQAMQLFGKMVNFKDPFSRKFLRST